MVGEEQKEIIEGQISNCCGGAENVKAKVIIEVVSPIMRGQLEVGEEGTRYHHIHALNAISKGEIMARATEKGFEQRIKKQIPEV